MSRKVVVCPSAISRIVPACSTTKSGVASFGSEVTKTGLENVPTG